MRVAVTAPSVYVLAFAYFSIFQLFPGWIYRTSFSLLWPEEALTAGAGGVDVLLRSVVCWCRGGVVLNRAVILLSVALVSVSRNIVRGLGIPNCYVAVTGSIKMFVLDEADEMLSRGFKEQIYDVFKFMPSDVQVLI